MEKWFPYFLDWINGKYSTIDSPLNAFFEINGYESKLFVKNIGSAIIYFLFYVLVWVLTMIM
jgi:hypothetical protein